MSHECRVRFVWASPAPLGRRLRRPHVWLALWLASLAGAAHAQTAVPSVPPSADGLWRPATDQTLPSAQRRTDFRGSYGVTQLNRAALDRLLAQAPNENAANRFAQPPVTVSLPLPDGTFMLFQVEESPLLSPEMAARYPGMNTYRGVGVSDPTATARLDVTPLGFHAMVLAGDRTVYVDPYSPGDLVNHVSYDKASRQPPTTGFVDDIFGSFEAQRLYNELPIVNGSVLRTYRLVMSTTGEYTIAAGGTSNAVSWITTMLNRINGIYEREVAVRLMWVNSLVYTDPTTDPFSNDNIVALVDQNQIVVNTVIGAASYDIAHVLGSGLGGGRASFGSVCNGGEKARAGSTSPNPFLDAFWVDYVAHEIGHQFGASHTFNSAVGECGPNRVAGHAYEVGSGESIMSYAGLCSSDNIAGRSSARFNVESLNEITAFVTSGGGSTCGTSTASGNAPPTVIGPGAAFSIPRLTPFALTASGTDPDGDLVMYSWEEHDLGTASTGGSSAATDDGSRPLFDAGTTGQSPTRYFPALSFIHDYANTPPLYSGAYLTGEVLPSTSRTMTFMVTARDNRGGIATAQTQVNVNGSVGPFAVTSPNTPVTWVAGSQQLVTWSVNGTAILAANVRIMLSTNNGSTYTLLTTTPNDGTEVITVPGPSANFARIKVEGVGSIFFDVSDTSLTIVPPGPPPGAFGKSAPTDWAANVSFTPVLSWGASVGATGYEYCVDMTRNATCDGGWTDVGGARSVTLSDLHPMTLYSWQVRAVNPGGSTQADGGTWWTFGTPFYANQVGDIAIDFGPGYGLWAYYGASFADPSATPTWRQLHGSSPGRLVRGDLDGNGRADLVMTFPGYGTWAFMNNSSYIQLHGLEAGTIETGDVNGNGRDDVVMTFVGYGTWIRYDDGGWAQIHGLIPNAIAVGNIDGSAGGRADVVLSFGVHGTWVYVNNTSWRQLHLLPGTRLKIGDLDGSGVGDLVVQFVGYGEWVLYNGTTWVQLHSLQAGNFAIGNWSSDVENRADLLISFPGHGTWIFVDNSYWQQLHAAVPSQMGFADIDGNGASEVIANFPGHGIWAFGVSWTRLHFLDPEAMATGRLDER